MTTEPQREAVSADLRIGQPIKLIGKPTRLGLCRADDRAEPRQNYYLTGITAFSRNEFFQIFVEGFRGRLLEMSSEYRLGVTGREPFAGIR